MNNVKQEVMLYSNYVNIDFIKESMERMIKQGWRVHTCLNKSSDVLVVYEKYE